MGYLIVMVRIPIWMMGAALGGWIAADMYMRLAWWWQARLLSADGGT